MLVHGSHPISTRLITLYNDGNKSLFMHRLRHPSLFRSIKWQKSCIMMHVLIFFKRHAMDHTHSSKVHDGVLVPKVACTKINHSHSLWYQCIIELRLNINCSNTAYYAILIYYLRITYSIWLYSSKIATHSYYLCKWAFNIQYMQQNADVIR